MVFVLAVLGCGRAPDETAAANEATVAAEVAEPRADEAPPALDTPPVARVLGPVVVRGRLLFGGEPLVGLRLELCGDGVANIHWRTPCAQAPARYTTTTDSDGAFELSGLPREDYQLFILDRPFHTQTYILAARLFDGDDMRDLGDREVRRARRRGGR